LRLRQTETVGNVGPVGDAEVLLAVELSLEELQLRVCERGSSTSKFLVGCRRRQLDTFAVVFRRFRSAEICNERLVLDAVPDWDRRAVMRKIAFKSCNVANKQTTNKND